MKEETQVKLSNCQQLVWDAALPSDWSKGQVEATSVAIEALTKLMNEVFNDLEKEDWQTIESAPKDGTEVLLNYHGGQVSGHWHDNGEAGESAEWGWVTLDDDGPLLDEVNTAFPTHWKPLSEGPQS